VVEGEEKTKKKGLKKTLPGGIQKSRNQGGPIPNIKTDLRGERKNAGQERGTNLLEWIGSR